jgi:ribosomal protein S18 acetylase RimI-like enzyme
MPRAKARKRSAEFRLLAYASADYRKAVALRQEVLRAPLGLRFTRAELLKEKGHAHVGGFLDGELKAAAALVPEGKALKMQRVAVDAGLQSRGIGSAMMAFCEAYAREKGFRELFCHARDTAVGFYLKNGYAKEGEPFEEDGVPHQLMRRDCGAARRRRNPR